MFNFKFGKWILGLALLAQIFFIPGSQAKGKEGLDLSLGAVPQNHCLFSDQCRSGGCGERVCANKNAFLTKDPIFQSLLSACLDGFTPKEKGMECVCADNICKWRNDPKDEEAIAQAAVEFMQEHYSPACKETAKVLEVKKLSRDHAVALTSCSCGMDCGYTCSFHMEKHDGKWIGLVKEYECAVR